MKNKATKQREARERQCAYNALSIEEKLTNLLVRPGESKKERAKLEALLERKDR